MRQGNRRVLVLPEQGAAHNTRPQHATSTTSVRTSVRKYLRQDLPILSSRELFKVALEKLRMEENCISILRSSLSFPAPLSPEERQ